MVMGIHITSWKLCSDGLPLSAGTSVTLADLSQARTMITQWCDFFSWRAKEECYRVLSCHAERITRTGWMLKLVELNQK